LRIRTHITILLVVAILGAVSLAVAVGEGTRRIAAAERSSGRLSNDYQRIQDLILNSREVLRVADLLSTESSGVTTIINPLIDRCRDDLTFLSNSEAMLFESSFIDEVLARFEDMVESVVVIVTQNRAQVNLETVGEKLDQENTEFDFDDIFASVTQIAQSEDKENLEEFEKALVLLDSTASRYLQTLERFEKHSSRKAIEEELAVANQWRWVACIAILSIFGYLLLIVTLYHWTTTKLVYPVQKLASQAHKAMANDLPFNFQEIGPTEVRSLSKTIHMFVQTLEEKVTERTQEIELQKVNLKREIIDRCQAEDRLRYSATHDALTDLPNRPMFLETLDDSISRAKQHEKYLFAVLFLDLDNFKMINDSLGHDVGDDLLCIIGQRLCQSVRSLDAIGRLEKNVVARFGGDEFVILLGGLHQSRDAILVAERISKLVSETVCLGTQDISPGMSIGIAVGSNYYQSASDILRDADIALYQAKKKGKGCYEIFNDKMRQSIVDRMKLEGDLRKVLDRNELFLEYQPQVSLTTGEIVGFEALVRWEHPQRGLIGPDEFIPIAEETKMIIPIGEWLLREACTQAVSWRNRLNQAADLSMSVNVSVKQIINKQFIDQVDVIMKDTGIDPGLLCLEITESVVIESNDFANILFAKLKERNIHIHMDDFGTGYSSLSYLNDLPIDAIKLDRYFIRNMKIDGKQAAVVQAVITLARNRDFVVIAEGTERADQIWQLQALDCDIAQGYYFSKPLDADAAESLIVNGGSWGLSMTA